MKIPEDRAITNICMLSTHGYFDPVPQLGRTDTGGQVVYVLQLARALARLKIAVDIYTRWFDRSSLQIDPVPDCPEVRVIRIPAGQWEFIPKEEIYRVLPELAQHMVQFIREKGLRYDLLHGHYVDAGIVTLDVAEAFDESPFFTAHSLGAWKREQMGGDPEEMEEKYRFSHRISEELRIFKSVSGQTVTTRLQKEKIAELYGFTSDNIVVIPPGVDVHTFRPVERGRREAESGFPESGLPERYIFCLSRIDANKGHDLLLEAFDIVAAAIPEVQLIIGGGSPKPKERESDVIAKMRRIIDEKNMQERVEIAGYIPDDQLVSHYQYAELFVLPSIFEPFGMTALEAMACGTPVIASKLGGIKDVISSGESGLLIDPSNKKEFADAITSLLRDRRHAEEIGRKGSETVHREFSWDAMAKKHVAFYKKSMHKKAMGA
jgi:mannosylfructose-phosphate synthase